MTKQLEEAISVFGSTCGYAVKTPGTPHLWEVNENAETLDAEKARIFHSVAAKLLYVKKRKRPDKEPEVAYFITRVENSNVGDWKKMKLCITFLKQSKEDKRIIGCFNLKEFFTWVDASFAVYPNMRSHIGGAISMVYGMIHCRSSKQKSNTKITTESELVGSSEYTPFNIWIILFYDAKGYYIT